MHIIMTLAASSLIASGLLALPAHAGPQNSETTQTMTLNGSPVTNLAAGVRSTATQTLQSSETTSGSSKTTQTLTAKNSPITNLAAGVGATATQKLNVAKQ